MPPGARSSRRAVPAIRSANAQAHEDRLRRSPLHYHLRRERGRRDRANGDFRSCVHAVMVRFPRDIVMMDVRMVSSGVPMIKRAHDIYRMRSNRRWSLYRRKENHPSAVTSMRRPDRDGAE